MPINAVCPECENRFQLQESLLGQSVRCPFCKTVFVVTANASTLTFEPVPDVAAPDPGTPTRPRADAPAPNYRTGSVTDFVQVVEGASVAKPAANGPKEVTWSPDMELPGGRREPAKVERYEPIPTYSREAARKPKKKHRGRALVGLIVFTLGGLAVGGFFLKRYMDFAPERLCAAGKKEYEDTHYEQARRLFDQIAKDYPDHPRAAEARFFGPLAGLRNAVASVMNKTDPTPAIGQWDQFQGLIADPALAPFAEKSRFGIDVWQAGTRLVEDTLAKGNEVFNRDDPTDAETWLQQAARVEAMLERFRPDDASKPESISRELAALRQKIDGSRARAIVLKEIRGLLAEPDDDRLQQARQVALAKGMEADDGYQKLVGEAEQKIRARAVYVAINPPLPKTPAPDDGLTSLLFAPRLDRGPRFPVRGPPTTFFALARGILYALDEADGKVLWAMRTGADNTIPAVSIPATDTTPELAVVPTSQGGQAGLHARHLRTGRSEWYQALPAPCAGEPLFIGTELYVPLADAQGTVLEIVAATGDVRGKIQLGRAIGGQPVIRPGTGQLFIPAEAASVYAFDVARRGPNNQHLDPALAGVIPTGHGPGALQGPIFFANPEPDNPGPRHLLAGVALGLDRMAVKACPFADAEGGAVNPAGAPSEIPVPGWSRFPAYCDGEKVAVVTDRRELLLFGINLGDNRDVTLFPLPSAPGQQTEESAGQLVMADEVNYWTLAGRELRRHCLGFANKDGAKLVPAGKGLRVGEPVQAAQTNARRDLMVIVAQEGGSFRVTAVSTESGELVWQRELGMLAKGEPFRRGDDLVWLDQGGGLTKLDTRLLTQDRTPVWLVDAEERWMVAAPAVGFRPLTDLVPGPDGTALVLLEGNSEKGRQFLLRVFNGARVDEQLVPAPGGLAGEPMVVGRFLVLPADNGTLYRLALDGGKILEEGPTWRGNSLPASSACFLAPLAGDDFLATDGNKSVVRWNWSTTTKRFESRGRLVVRGKFRAKPFVVSMAPPRMLTVDQTGGLSLWDADKFKPDLPPLRLWQAADKDAALPGNDRIDAVIPVPGVPELFALIGNRHAFGLRFDADKPVWATAGQFVNHGREAGGNVLVTERNAVRRLALATGELSAPLFQAGGPYAVGGGAVPLGDRRLLVPLADGTLLLAEAGPGKAPLAPGKP